MRNLKAACVSIGLVAMAGIAHGAEPAARTEENAQYMLEVLRAEATRQGIQLPEPSTILVEGTSYDAATGTFTDVVLPLDSLLREIASLAGPVSLADLPTQADVPVLGVGNNAHAYVNLRPFQCSPKGYYSGWRTAQEVPPGFVPNPLFPVVPMAGVLVYGGPGFHVKGSGWLLGLHAFLGSPIDFNVNTAGSTSGVPVSHQLTLGLDSSIDTVAVGRIFMSSTAIRFLGICLASIDAGILLENGALGVNGQLVPDNPAGL